MKGEDRLGKQEDSEGRDRLGEEIYQGDGLGGKDIFSDGH